MGKKKKKSGNEKRILTIVLLATAILDLIDAVIRVIGHLIE